MDIPLCQFGIFKPHQLSIYTSKLNGEEEQVQIFDIFEIKNLNILQNGDHIHLELLLPKVSESSSTSKSFRAICQGMIDHLQHFEILSTIYELPKEFIIEFKDYRKCNNNNESINLNHENTNCFISYVYGVQKERYLHLQSKGRDMKKYLNKYFIQSHVIIKLSKKE